MLIIGKMKVNKAFTLIEIVLVVLVVGIILAIAMPNFFKGYSKLQINETADDLLNVSRWAQAMAIGQERIYALSFSNDHQSYKLVRVKTNEDDNDQITFEPVVGNLGRKHVIPDSIRIVLTQSYDANETGGIDRIEFYPDGTIDPATIELDSLTQNIKLSSQEVRGMMTKVNDE